MTIIRQEQTQLQRTQTEQLDAGYLSGGAITDNLDGTIDVDPGVGFIRESGSSTAVLRRISWIAASAVALTDNASNYVYIDYNAGTPIVAVQVGGSGITDNENDKFELAEIYREGTDLHITPHKQLANSALNMIQQRLYSITPIERANGILIGETGTRNVTVSSGLLWTKLDKTPIAAIDTSGSDTFDRFYTNDSGATWQKQTGQTQWDNLQYNDITSGLVALAANKYSNQYFYIEPDGHLSCVYGQAFYNTPAAANNEGSPSLIPPRLEEHALLIGRIRFEQAASVADAVQSSFDDLFTASGVTQHNNLANLTYDLSGHGSGYNGFLRGATISSSNPTSTDDSSAGYVPGDLWVNTTSDESFICVDNTASAAIWHEIEHSVSDIWDKSGTTISPANANDKLALTMTTTADDIGIKVLRNPGATNDQFNVASEIVATTPQTDGVKFGYGCAITANSSDTAAAIYAAFYADTVTGGGSAAKVAFWAAGSYDTAFEANSGNMQFTDYSATIRGVRGDSGDGYTITIKGGNAFDSGATDRAGGILNLEGGDPANSGLAGNVRITTPDDAATQTWEVFRTDDNFKTTMKHAAGAANYTVTWPAKSLTVADVNYNINFQTGTTYTVTATDSGGAVIITNVSAITLTLPQNSTENLDAGFNVTVIQGGAGQITFAVEGTDTLLSENSWTKTVRAGSAVTAIKLASGSWSIAGSLTT